MGDDDSDPVVVHPLCVVVPVVCEGLVLGPYFVLGTFSSLAIILRMFLYFNSVVAVCIMCVFLTVPWVGLQSNCDISWSFAHSL